VTPDGHTVWTADGASRTITAHRAGDPNVRARSIDVGGAPLSIAISPDGLRALVATAYYDHPGLALVDLRSGQTDRIDVGPEPYAVAFAPDGHTAWVANSARDGELVRVRPSTGRVHAAIALGSHPRGLAITPDGEHALVALNGDSAVAVVALRHGRVVRRIATGAYPYQIAISPNGMHAWVTHNDFGARRATPLDLKHWRAGRAVATGLDPSGIAYGRAGRTVVVAESGSGTISVLDAHSGRRRRRVKAGKTPRAIVVSRRHVFVVDGRSGHLTAVRA